MSKALKIGIVAVSAVLVGTLAFTGTQNQNQQSRIRTLTDTVSTVQTENSTLKKQLEQNGSSESTPAAASSNSTSSLATASSAAVSTPNANHDMEAAEALSMNLIQKFYTVSDKSNFDQVKSEICSMVTDDVKNKLYGSSTGSSAASSASSTVAEAYTSTCTISNLYSHRVNDTTIQCLAVCNIATKVNGNGSYQNMLVLTTVVNQNGKLAIDKFTSVNSNDIHPQDFQ